MSCPVSHLLKDWSSEVVSNWAWRTGILWYKIKAIFDQNNNKSFDFFIFIITESSVKYFLKLHLHHSSQINCHKEVIKSRNQDFSYYFCLMIEGSRAGAGSGSVPRTNRPCFWSGRPKNIRIRLRIRIRNTARKDKMLKKLARATS